MNWTLFFLYLVGACCEAIAIITIIVITWLGVRTSYNGKYLYTIIAVGLFGSYFIMHGSELGLNKELNTVNAIILCIASYSTAIWTENYLKKERDKKES